jgi:hypothetical protein
MGVQGSHTPEAVRKQEVNGLRDKKSSELLNHLTVPQTDTGRRVEKTKANGKIFVKELGKITL